jgi:hypothetical protein
MLAAEALQGLSRQQEGALDIAAEVVWRKLVHQGLDGLSRTLSPHLVVPQSLSHPER